MYSLNYLLNSKEPVVEPNASEDNKELTELRACTPADVTSAPINLPTPELINLPNSLVDAFKYTNGDLYFEYETINQVWEGTYSTNIPEEDTKYLVLCRDTRDVWLCLRKQILDDNFLFRDDLEIKEIKSDLVMANLLVECIGECIVPNEPTKVCYILDKRFAEEYTPYYDPNYPELKYGKKTPVGMAVLRFGNRFKRDAAIRVLEEKYAEKPFGSAVNLVSKKLPDDAAIIVSDGSKSDNSISAAFYYVDNSRIEKGAIALEPSTPEQGVLIAEILGATKALLTCETYGKKKITYYYDNCAIIHVFNSEKLREVPEVKTYKALCESLVAKGYDVTFCELHPKRGKKRSQDNAALTYFHHNCDKTCTELIELYRGRIAEVAAADTSKGSKYSELAKPKQQRTRKGQKQKQ